MRRITTVGFDADDTLWHNERAFRMTEERFAALLADVAPPERIAERLLETERRNLEIYGYGVKGFALSMIETALELGEGRAPDAAIAEILAAAKEMMRHPVEPLPHARAALEALRGRVRLVLVTKGDLFDQERKIAQSGLGELFEAVEIVSDKNRATYERVFKRHGDGPEKSMMIGNSLKSDVLPAIEAGGWGVYVPHDLTWAYEHAEAPEGEARFRQVAHLGEVARLIDEIERG
jgi:putative hydrolase of the HAD superfamily